MYVPSIILKAFVLAMAVPLFYGTARLAIAGVQATMALALHVRQTRRPLAPVELTGAPLRPDLSLEMRRLASMTRGLVASLEFASQRSAGWRDDVPRSRLARWISLGREEDYRPTIGVTGEIWAWLQTAEALADSEDPNAEDVGHTASAVRGALLRRGSIGPRLNEVLVHLVAADAYIRSGGDTPYRGPAPIRAPQGDGDDDPDARRRIEHERALVEHDDTIVHAARRFTQDEDAARDLVQEIRLSVWNALDRYRGDASVRTYIARIAHYRAVSHARRQRTLVPEQEAADPRPDPGELLDDARRRVAVAEAIQELPNGQREAIALLLEGLSYREISARLGISAKATSVRLTRARRALRRRLACS